MNGDEVPLSEGRHDLSGDTVALVDNTAIVYAINQTVTDGVVTTVYDLALGQKVYDRWTGRVGQVEELQARLSLSAPPQPEGQVPADRHLVISVAVLWEDNALRSWRLPQDLRPHPNLHNPDMLERWLSSD